MMSLTQAAEMVQGQLFGNSVEFNAVSTDTRSLNKGDLYIALQGERFDGHDFIEQAIAAGAVGALVHKTVDVSLPVVKVEDTRRALAQLAEGWRRLFKGRVVGITGSNGKTTVKEMSASILAEQGKVMATQGNFNNDIGLPLTLLRMRDEDFAVIEMGANHAGEIAGLTAITHPDVALITNAGEAHLEGFGSLEGVSRAKGEIYQGLGKQGVAIINRDDQFASYWRSICEAYQVIEFSLQDKSADVYGECKTQGETTQLKVFVDNEILDIRLNVLGEHNAMNALAAIAAGKALQVSYQCMIDGLQKFTPVKGRLNLNHLNDSTIVIDDTYNANPSSLMAGLKVLKTCQGESWLVLGDMGELGEDTQRLHADVGCKAHEAGIDRLLALGEASRYAAEAFGDNGRFFESTENLLAYVQENRPQELGILVKGSRFMRMEQVVESLKKGLG